MTKDRAVSEIVAVLLLIAIATVVVGIIAVFFFSNTQIQKIPEVDLSFSTNATEGALTIYEQRGEPLYYNTTQIQIGTQTIPLEDKKSELILIKKNGTSFRWSSNPSEPYAIGDSLKWYAPNAMINEGLAVNVVYDIPSGGILIDKIGYQSGDSGAGSGRYVRVTSPNGGENWQAGSVHQITWTPFNITPTSYTLVYSTDNGLTWKPIATIPGTSTDYSWTVPPTPTTYALVRITGTDSDGTTVTDTSDRVFTISASGCSTPVHAGFTTRPTLLITTDNSLEVAFTDNSSSDDPINHPVSIWTWDLGDGTIISGKGPITHQYAEGEYYARLYVSNGCTEDRASVYISVGPGNTHTPSVTVENPQTGDVWVVGTTHQITWTPHYLEASRYTIEYYDGTSWIPITTVPGTQTTYDWVIPNTPTDNAQVRVTGYDGTGAPVPGLSGIFTISYTPPQVTVTSPNDGTENWFVGSTHPVTWTSNFGAVNYTIQYSINGGSTWIQVASNVPAGTTSYNWLIPDTPTTHALVQITGYTATGTPVTDLSDNEFTITRPEVGLTSPNGGENWYVNSTHPITWTSNFGAANYTIQYSTDGGTTWQTVTTNLPGTQTTFDWVVPNTPTDQALVRITGYDTLGNPIADQSNQVFTISKPTTTLSSPNGGEDWYVDSTHPITWSTNFTAANFTLEYSTNAGGTWTTIATNIPTGTTSYNWQVPDTPTDQALMKVTGYDQLGNPIVDQSDQVFSIIKPVVTVTSPNTGTENWFSFSNHPITWSTNFTAANFTLEYSTDGGTTWTTITSNIPGDQRTYDWTVPDTPTTQALVRVTGYDDQGNKIPDQSDNPFTITRPSVNLTAPNGGENWYVNTTHQITWNSNYPATNYTIQYSNDGGSTWQTVITNLPAGSGAYDWNIPDTPTTLALVKVIGYDAYGNQIPDQSDAVFTISKPTVKVTSPNGGEDWYVNTTHPITWESNFTAANYTIQYSTNGGSSWNTIATNIPTGTSSYNWQVPDTPTDQALVKVIAYDAQGYQIPDQSDTVFTISKPTTTVIAPNGGENWYVNTTHPITWTTNFTAANYTIQYSTNAGGSWTTIATNLPTGTTSFNWIVNDTPTNQALVKVIAYDSQGYQIPDQSDTVFTISKPTTTVIVPNGGENWYVNTTHPITWTTNFTAANYTIQYSTNAGGSWTTIATNIPPGTTSFNWIVNDTPTNQALVKVIAYDAQGYQIPDQSDTVFTISKPTTTVITPNGGENWYVNTTHPITWTTNFTAANYTIQYSTNAGGTWTTIATNIPPGTTSFDWIVNDTPTNQALVKVIAYDAQGYPIPDQSDAVFTISKPAIEVESPNGGEIWMVNSTHPITWSTSSMNVTNFTILYSINNGTTWLPVTANLPGNATSYNWQVPNTPTTQALVKVIASDSDGYQIADQSDQVFTISDASLRVDKPNGGEYWLVNTTNQITWTPSNLTAERYTIQYSINNGTTWLPVVSNLPGSSTSYNWQVPNTPTTQALVKVMGYDYYGNLIADQSDKVFTIADPTVTVITPNGGENYRVNTSHLITWSWNNLTPTNFTVEYSVNNGTGWIPIASNLTGATNAYTWLVPDTPTTQALVKVTGYDAYGNRIADQSNAVFTISKPNVTVISPNGGEIWFTNTKHQITWNSSAINVTNYTLQYTIDGGSTWVTIATNVPPTNTSYLWTVPNTPTAFALVKVIAYEADGTQFTDLSDNFFTIRAPRDCIGGRIFVTDSRVNVTFTYTFSDAGYRNVYSLFSPRTIPLGNNRETPRNTSWDLGRFNAGDELIFKDLAVDTGNNFYSGPASRNPDNRYHAWAYEISESSVWLGFEDTFGGGDNDFNDIQFRVENGVMVVCPGDVPNITVTDPNGGENWLVGSTHPITWSTNYIAPRNYTLEYSVNNGGSWTTIATNVSGTDTAYNWLVPNTPTTQALVRITAYDAAGLSVTDRSDAVFTISNPKINLTAPNGGEIWQVGSSHQITWNATGLNATSYALRYSTDNGTSWFTVATNLSPNSTSFNWTIPNTPTTQALVEVIATDTGGNQITDRSDRVFTIATPVVTVKTPNGGEIWQVGSNHQITWNTTNLTPDNFTIQYSLNNGTTWLSLVTGLSGANTSYNWTVPNSPTTQALVRVTATDVVGNLISDQSDRVFTIATPTVTVQSPNGGETWLVGTNHQITWSTTNFTAVNYTIMYSTTNGSTWLPVALNLPSTNTSHNWTVPNTPTTQALVKVIGYDALGNQVDDQSDAVFTISRPSVTVVSPNGGEVWYVGGTRPITWNTTDPSLVTSTLIEYSIDNGATWQTINITTGSPGYYNWVIPNTPTTTALVRVTASYGPLGTVTDRSDNVFTIALWTAPECSVESGEQYGRIVVVKYNDLNGNGAQDFGEPNIPWWTITTEYEPPTTQDPNLTNLSPTNEDGYYCTPCIKNARWYTVSEEARTGWVATTITSSTDKMRASDPVQYRYLFFGNRQV